MLEGQLKETLWVIRYLLFEKENVAFEGDVKQRIIINY
jgi:hypothetical protein